MKYNITALGDLLCSHFILRANTSDDIGFSQMLKHDRINVTTVNCAATFSLAYFFSSTWHTVFKMLSICCNLINQIGFSGTFERFLKLQFRANALDKRHILMCHNVCSFLFPHKYSLCNEPLIELSNPGASGSIFYVSSDDEFIIKTVQHKEAEFLQKLLPGYFMVSLSSYYNKWWELLLL